MTKKSKATTMAKPVPPRNLTPAFCERLRWDLLAACRQVADTHGLAVEGGDLSEIDLRHGFDIGFRVGIPTPDGSLFSHERALFEALAGSFGLEPSDYARIFRTGGETFRITAINPNRPKYPINVERIADGRGYKFSAEDVALYLSQSGE
ncbi:hypothetical protein [uncultured Jannaschia sp.]|uniref:hypothetical protein n=1 Tax=uncultured Jannaschia sp. TaxID=293347 RepID=UPI00260BB629|nr:hypothetical protein [uncultured Jannaschia sp.]